MSVKGGEWEGAVVRLDVMRTASFEVKNMDCMTRGIVLKRASKLGFV